MTNAAAPVAFDTSPSRAFAEDGFLGPFRVFGAAECRQISAYLARERHPAPAEWAKGRAVHERFLYDLAVRPALLRPIVECLGPDVVLWGAIVVRRAPGAIHPWHSDIESSSPDGGFATAWIGIEHTTRESALQLIARSHRLGQTVQQARAARGLRREEATPDALLAIAREHDAAAAFVQPEMGNGEAVIFDGRLWHGSDNARRGGDPRVALVLHYAAADRAVHIPDFTQLDWPFRLRSTPRPPSILVSGSDRGAANRLVPAPPPASGGMPMIITAVHRFELPVDAPPADWKPFHAFHGPTRTLTDMSCHASVLVGGHSPHPPHTHREEELLIPLHGEAEIVIATSPTDPSPRVERLRPGSFVYYPAWQHHTIRNPGTSAISYLMFKWDAAASAAPQPLATGIHRYPAAAPIGAPPFSAQRIFEGPTSWLGKLHAHLTVLAPGAGYEPHVDAYDVAILTLEGTVETLGRRVEPMSVIYYSGGEVHGMRNVGTEPARYLVFEFHAPGVDALPPPIPLARALPRQVLRLGKRAARPVWRWIKPRLPGARPPTRDVY